MGRSSPGERWAHVFYVLSVLLLIWANTYCETILLLSCWSLLGVMSGSIHWLWLGLHLFHVPAQPLVQPKLVHSWPFPKHTEAPTQGWEVLTGEPSQWAESWGSRGGESQCGLWQTLLTLSSTATWPHVPVWGSAEGPPAASFRSMVAGSGGKGENGGKDLCVTFPSNTFHLHAARSNSGKDHRGFVYFCLSPAHLCRFGPPHWLSLGSRRTPLSPSPLYLQWWKPCEPSGPVGWRIAWLLSLSCSDEGGAVTRTGLKGKDIHITGCWNNRQCFWDNLSTVTYWRSQRRLSK